MTVIEIKCNNCPFTDCEDSNEFCRIYGTKVETFTNDNFRIQIKREDAIKLMNLKEEEAEKP